MPIPDKHGKSLAVVIPMYNEIAGAEHCITEVLSALASLNAPLGFIVVDDGSTDGTSETLDKLANQPGGFVVVHQDNMGYGGALRAGARRALEEGYEFVLFMDSDLTNPPNHIGRFLVAIGKGWDLVKGCRFSTGGGMVGVPNRRALISRLGNIIAAELFRVGLKDCTNGFRAIRTKLFLDMPLRERGFPVIVEELYWAKKKGSKITSVPTTLYSRREDQRPSLFAYKPRVFCRYLSFSLKAFMVHLAR